MVGAMVPLPSAIECFYDADADDGDNGASFWSSRSGDTSVLCDDDDEDSKNDGNRPDSVLKRAPPLPLISTHMRMHSAKINATMIHSRLLDFWWCKTSRKNLAFF